VQSSNSSFPWRGPRFPEYSTLVWYTHKYLGARQVAVLRMCCCCKANYQIRDDPQRSSGALNQDTEGQVPPSIRVVHVGRCMCNYTKAQACCKTGPCWDVCVVAPPEVGKTYGKKWCRNHSRPETDGTLNRRSLVSVLDVVTRLQGENRCS
jgi:hypothetical protein